MSRATATTTVARATRTTRRTRDVAATSRRTTRARGGGDDAGRVFAPARDGDDTQRDAFDGAHVGAPVVKAFRGDDATRWTMWYAATNARGDDSIAIATSEDGVTWRRGDSDAVMYRNDVDGRSIDVGRVFGANGEDWWTFDTRGTQLGDVQLISSDSISGGSVYWMFYHGYDHGAAAGAAAATTTTRPGLAFSQDGRNWARFEGEHHTGAVFDRGEDGAWDARGVRDPKVLLAGPRDIRVYYASIDARTGKSAVGLALTADGFAYNKRGSEAIFGPGPSGSFDDAGVAAPCVVRLGRDEFIMFYEAYSSSAPGVASVAVATSRDGVSWTRPSAPALEAGAAGAWDQGGVGKPYAVPMAGDRIRLYYEGRAAAGDERGAGVGVALSTDADRFVFARRTSD